jgi:formate/nitrite transporter FocA (FNT family)
MEVSRGAGGVGVTFIRAIIAGWLIALMVWLLPAAESARVSIIIIITYLIGLGGFNHVVAGSTKLLFLVVSRAETWATVILRFFLPTLLGNVVVCGRVDSRAPRCTPCPSSRA